jgi:hypothetical protein
MAVLSVAAGNFWPATLNQSGARDDSWLSAEQTHHKVITARYSTRSGTRQHSHCHRMHACRGAQGKMSDARQRNKTNR